MAKKKESVEVIKDAGENAIFNKETEGLSQGQMFCVALFAIELP